MTRDDAHTRMKPNPLQTNFSSTHLPFCPNLLAEQSKTALNFLLRLSTPQLLITMPTLWSFFAHTNCWHAVGQAITHQPALTCRHTRWQCICPPIRRVCSGYSLPAALLVVRLENPLLLYADAYRCYTAVNMAICSVNVLR